MSENDCEVEYGCIHPIGFVPGKLYDSENKEILCKCGKVATQVIIGKTAFMARCEKCWDNAEKNA